MSAASADFRAKCRKCECVFSVCPLPAPIDVFVEAANKAFCPVCQAGPRHLCLATEPLSPPVKPRMTTKRRIQERFELYSQMAIPAGTSAVIVTVLRQAFLAGAAASIGVLSETAKDDGPGKLFEVLPGMIEELREAAREADGTVGTPVEASAK